MSIARVAAAVIGAGRVAYGAALIVAPKQVAGAWVGKTASKDSVQLLARSVGIRDVAINAGIVVAALTDAPVRPWLAASIVGDLSDIAATAAGRAGIPRDAPRNTALVAGASALLSTLVLSAVDR